MVIPFIDRYPTPDEVEAIRYLLSAYTGALGSQYIQGKLWPGWHDFERVIALVVGGKVLKSKGPYDISIQLSQNSYAGVSCKVKRLKPSNIERRKRLYLEVSNKNSATRVCVGGSERFVLPDNTRDAFAIGEKLIECIESEYGINAGRKYNYDINRLGLVLMHWNIDDSGKFWFTLYNWRGPFRIFDTIVH